MTTQSPPETAPALSPQEAAAMLQGSYVALQSLIEALPSALLAWQPAPGEWCALEVIGHLVETDERGFGGRVRALRAEERPQFSGWDPDAVALARRDAERDPADLLAEFTQRRLGNIALVESLTAEDLDCGGDHPQVGYLTARDLLHEWVHHDANHLQQILANVQAYTWPNMGNSQRFSGDG